MSTGQVRITILNTIHFMQTMRTEYYVKRMKQAYAYGASPELISEAYGIPLDVVTECVSQEQK